MKRHKKSEFDLVHASPQVLKDTKKDLADLERMLKTNDRYIQDKGEFIREEILPKKKLLMHNGGWN